MTDTCRTCKFYRKAPLYKECRRYPQALTKQPDDWCGEFAPVQVEKSKLGQSIKAAKPASKTIRYGDR